MINLKDFRIVYMGTPIMSAKILRYMIEEGFNVVAVIAQEDKPVGRKGTLEKVPTKVVAEEFGIPVYQPHRMRKEFEFARSLNADLILTMAYGQIVPQELLDMPKLGALNLHGSILPKYRGAAPIQRAIMNGEKETGVTLMEMVDKMDAGKMFGTVKCEISDCDNYTSLCEKIVDCGKQVVKTLLPLYFEGKLNGVEQDENLVTFADKISKEDEKLDLNKSTYEFINFLRSISETPGGYLVLDDKKFKILGAKKWSDSTQKSIGTLTINKRLILQLKDGEIELTEVQLEGKKKMDGRSFANGNQKLNQTILK